MPGRVSGRGWTRTSSGRGDSERLDFHGAIGLRWGKMPGFRLESAVHARDAGVCEGDAAADPHGHPPVERRVGHSRGAGPGLGQRARRSGSRRTLGERGVPRRDLPLRCEPSNVGRMSSPRRPNARKPWTPDDTATLQRLAEAGIPSNLIADRLGRTIMSVSSQAEKLRLSIGKGKAARAVERKQARRFGNDDPPLR